LLRKSSNYHYLHSIEGRMTEKTASNGKHLPGFAAFLLKNHLEEFAKAALRISRLQPLAGFAKMKAAFGFSQSRLDSRSFAAESSIATCKCHHADFPMSPTPADSNSFMSFLDRVRAGDQRAAEELRVPPERQLLFVGAIPEQLLGPTEPSRARALRAATFKYSSESGTSRCPGAIQ